eukprot:g7180.t1
MSRFRVSSTPYDNDATTIQRNPVVAGMGPHGFSKSAVYNRVSKAFPHLYSDHQWVLSQRASSTQVMTNSGESRVNQLKTIQYLPQNVLSMYQAAANHVGRSDESAESKRGESHKAHVASVPPKRFTMFEPCLGMISFVTEFRDHYVRNNRSKGQKNLRCFPSCNSRGHSDHGFCGSAMKCRAVLSSDVPYTRLRCFAEIRVESITGNKTKGVVSTTCPGGLSPGVTVARSNLRGHVKCESKPFAPLFELSADCIDASKAPHVVVEFSVSPASWHYGWRSSKYAKNYVHYVRAYLCVEYGENVTCLNIEDSSRFQISSSKRCRASGILKDSMADSVAVAKQKSQRPGTLKRKMGRKAENSRHRKHSSVPAKKYKRDLVKMQEGHPRKRSAGETKPFVPQGHGSDHASDDATQTLLTLALAAEGL